MDGSRGAPRFLSAKIGMLFGAAFAVAGAAVSFDGKMLYSASDRTIVSAGRVALWTKADSVTRFDRRELQVLP